MESRHASLESGNEVAARIELTKSEQRQYRDSGRYSIRRLPKLLSNGSVAASASGCGGISVSRSSARPVPSKERAGSNPDRLPRAWSEGSQVRYLMICGQGNNLDLTLGETNGTDGQSDKCACGIRPRGRLLRGRDYD